MSQLKNSPHKEKYSIKISRKILFKIQKEMYEKPHLKQNCKCNFRKINLNLKQITMYFHQSKYLVQISTVLRCSQYNIQDIYTANINVYHQLHTTGHGIQSCLLCRKWKNW